MSSELVHRCRDEVIDLHEFFVDWFTGAIENSAVEFARFAAASHPNFTMIVPSGQLLDKAAVVEGLRRAHGSRTGREFRIEIRDIVERMSNDTTVLITYEEWQFVGADLRSARTSTAVFEAARHAPNGVVWRHLHETLLEHP